MSANRFGEVQTTPRAKVRAAPAQDVYGKSRVVEADVTDWASNDGMVPAESEEQRPLLRRQAVRTSAVTMRQKATIRLDDVAKRNRLGALRALRLHVAPLCVRPPAAASRPGVRTQTPLRETHSINVGAQGERHKDSITASASRIADADGAGLSRLAATFVSLDPLVLPDEEALPVQPEPPVVWHNHADDFLGLGENPAAAVAP